MAEKRMISISLVDDDRFLDMSQGAQLLYFHLSMRADDDGFFSPKKTLRTVNAKQSSLDELVENRYVIMFPSGAGCITHWYANNTIKSDRYKESQYPERNQVELRTIDGRKEYVLRNVSATGTNLEPQRNQTGTKMEPERNQLGTNLEPQDRIGKRKKELSLSKESSSKKESSPHGTTAEPEIPGKPSLDEAKAYFRGNLLSGDPEAFYDHYEAVGWRIGSTPVVDWRAAARKWAVNERKFGYERSSPKGEDAKPRDYDGSYDGHRMKEVSI